MGLISDGQVHSSLTHLYALLQMAKDRGLDRVFIHCFLDGRDTPPSSSVNYVAALQRKIARSVAAKSRRWSVATTQWIATSAGKERSVLTIC